MKFRDLEIGQTFRRAPEGITCTKTGVGLYTYECPPHGKHSVPLTKRERNLNVIPEGEPPSAIAAAERDKRWWILTHMDVTVDEVRAMRDRESIGMFEAQRLIKQQKLIDGLDVLKLEIEDLDEKTQRVLHDLIEIVRELV